MAADDYEAAVLTRQSQHRLELAALDGPHRGGSAAHPQALELPLAGGDRLRLTPHLPHLIGGTAGLQTPGHHAQKQTHNLQAHRHSAQLPHTHLEHLETQMTLKKQEARAAFSTSSSQTNQHVVILWSSSGLCSRSTMFLVYLVLSDTFSNMKKKDDALE